ncbi:MAG: hypothetical protein MR029_01735 [Clostridium sp.]|nr:hypothetical protein [Clostridium sp.]
MGMNACFSKKEVAFGFWANVKQFPVKDIRGYNRATGKLFIIYGLILIVLGLPLLKGQNNPYILLSVLGVMIETIAIMVIYGMCVEAKYKE